MLDLKLAVIATAASLAVGFGVGWAIKGWKTDNALQKKDAQIAQIKQGHAETLNHLHRANLSVYKAVQAAIAANQSKDSLNERTALAALKTEQEKTAHWRDLVRKHPDAVSVRVQGAACVGDRSSSDNAAASSVGDGVVEIVGEVRHTVFDLRDSIASDAAKLDYLQGYAAQCEAAGIEAGRINGAEVK